MGGEAEREEATEQVTVNTVKVEAGGTALVGETRKKIERGKERREAAALVRSKQAVAVVVLGQGGQVESSVTAR